MDAKQLFKHWTYQIFAPGTLLRRKYEAFKTLLAQDNIALQLIADLEELFYGDVLADRTRAAWLCSRLSAAVGNMAGQLVEMNPGQYMDLPEYYRKIDFYVRMALELDQPEAGPPFILSLAEAADARRLAGGKASNLARALRDANAPVPPGFVVTANAFHYFIESNGLGPDMEKRLRRMVVGDRNLLAQLTLEMQELILEGEVPEEIARGIRLGVSEIIGEDDLIAVRSSALSEDGDISFAGQYASELNVHPNDAVEAYKRVLAGKYCPRAVSYRITHGLTDSDTAMAVLILPMVEAEHAGVIYTDDPDCKGEQGRTMGVYAVRGLGNSLVDGSARPIKATLTRDKQPEPIEGCDPDQQGMPDPDDLRKLGRIAMHLEKRLDGPQDVEWAIDSTGKIFILQTRPLQSEREEAGQADHCILAKPLAQQMERASGGAGCGEIYHAATGADFANIPDGAVVVTPMLKPALAGFVGSLNAVIAHTGSRASHFASVAREAGIPVLIGDYPMESLPEGQLVTVDGATGSVYEGCVEEVLTRAMQRKAAPEHSLAQYKPIIPLTVKLNLTDPAARNFSPVGCRSLHDVVRFCHEKAVGEMFTLVDKTGRGMGGAKRLTTSLPIVMYVLDLGDGLFEGAGVNSREVSADDIRSRPMWALWYGLADPRVPWSNRLTHMDWEEFDRMSGGIFRFDSKLLASYALISDDYLHLMVRFGYHFSVVDTVCGNDPGANYISFRFKGGGAAMDNRVLRLAFITRILERYGFEVSAKGDLLDAKCARMDENDTRKRLARLGYLMAVTRLMDMSLNSEEDVDKAVDNFFRQAENHEDSQT